MKRALSSKDGAMMAPGFVYILRSPWNRDLYKIGMTTNLPQRMKALSLYGDDLIATIRTNNPRYLEHRIHQDHAQYWQWREWFLLPDTILAELIASFTTEDGDVHEWGEV